MSEAVEAVVKVVEDATSKVSKSKKIVQVDATPKAADATSWLSSLLKYGSQIFVFWIGIVIIQGIFSVQASWTFNNKIKNVDATSEVKLKNNEAVVFDAEDVSTLNAKPGTIEDVTSDHTTYDILKGKFGALVIMIWAPQCHFCKEMMPAQEEAASKASVPFVRVEGKYLKQVFKHFQIQGQPTIYGIDAQGKLVPFMSQRTAENLIAFAKKLNPAVVPVPVIVKPVEPPAVQTVKVELLDENEVVETQPTEEVKPVESKKPSEDVKPVEDHPNVFDAPVV